MNYLLPLTVVLILVSTTHSSGGWDRICASDPSNLWLDIVIVVDNSKNLTNNKLELIHANIVELLGEGTRIGTNYDDPRTTRVGLVTYNQNATIVADLNKFQTFQDLYDTAEIALSTVATTESSFLQKGLAAAEQLLLSGRSNNYRSNYKQLVIVYALMYEGTGTLDPLPVANRLKNNGVTIAVVDMISGKYWEDTSLSMIASGNMFWWYDYRTAFQLMNAALQTNCHCRNTWVQFLPNPGTYARGVCVKVFNQTTSWQIAKISCQDTIANGYLVTDFASDKHQFLQALFQNTTGFSSGYHIGLTYLDGAWYWQQPAGQSPFGLTGSNVAADIFWNTAYPKSMTSNTGVATIKDGNQTGWENINAHNSMQYYICEVDACDTDNYCPWV